MNSTAAITSTTPPAPLTPMRHPRGLYVLFFTEMWERFSYYGMRPLLVLFMTHAVTDGGMALDKSTASIIYALYTCMVYLASLPGGWVADRLLGAQRTVLCGGIVIAAGHFTMALPGVRTFFLGMVFLVIGTGLLKPNISAIVGGLYPEGGSRRDAGFSIFYMGINLGAFLSPFVCGTLGEKYNWHYGFGAAGVGMLIGLIQFMINRRYLGEAGNRPGSAKPLGKAGKMVAAGTASALVVVVIAAFAGWIPMNPQKLWNSMLWVISGASVLYFAGIFSFCQLDRHEAKRMLVIVVLFVCAVLFWAGFEQAGSFFNLFADLHTVRVFTWLNSQLGKPPAWDIPASWFQSVNPVFVIVLAPLFAGMWVRLARRNLDPSIPVKFGLGLVFLAIGFLIMMGASMLVAAGHKVLPTWLLSIYLIHTFGELCLSPVGLSSVTKLAPPRFVGQMLGVWFVASSLGNLLAGKIASDFDEDKLAQWPKLCVPMIVLPMVAGGLLILLSRPIKRLMEGVK